MIDSFLYLLSRIFPGHSIWPNWKQASETSSLRTNKLLWLQSLSSRLSSRARVLTWTWTRWPIKWSGSRRYSAWWSRWGHRTWYLSSSGGLESNLIRSNQTLSIQSLHLILDNVPSEWNKNINCILSHQSVDFCSTVLLRPIVLLATDIHSKWPCKLNFRRWKEKSKWKG